MDYSFEKAMMDYHKHPKQHAKTYMKKPFMKLEKEAKGALAGAVITSALLYPTMWEDGINLAGQYGAAALQPAARGLLRMVGIPFV